MDNAYDAPQSDLGQGQNHSFSFSNLGFWRKLYIVLNWVFGIALAAFFQASPFVAAAQDKVAGVGLIQMLLVTLTGAAILLYTYWLHSAVSKRNITQINILTVIQIVPLMNLIGLVIMLAIRSTSKTEVESAG